ncbi:MAG: LytTR family DNA-binding domain-containing protein [Oscillospiraceae bacterium]|nr:LytTR family DNA-binding domain-containing protein [Oscillospiraceae bacterium]
MRFAVCDDDMLFQNEIKKAVYTYSNMRNLDLAVDEYICGEDLLNSSYEYDVVFMDYRMSGINGLETAKILRGKNKDCVIIFLTSYSKIVYEVFEVSAFRFFEKPLDVDKLHKALDDYFTTIGDDYPILLKVGRETVCIKTNEVFYLEADNKKCFVNLVNESLHCARTMASIAAQLPASIFHKVNKAFIVNINHIKNYDKEYVYFTNGARVPASRKYLPSFKEAYKNYAKGRSL